MLNIEQQVARMLMLVCICQACICFPYKHDKLISFKGLVHRMTQRCLEGSAEALTVCFRVSELR